MHKIIYTGLETPRDKQTYLWKKKDENGNVALYEYKGTKWEKITGPDYADVLNELLNMVSDLAEDTPRPIVLTSVPAEDDTYEDIIGIGLTPQEIKEAQNGKRTSVLAPGVTFFITQAIYDADNDCAIAFYEIVYGEGGALDSITGFRIVFTGEHDVEIVRSEV